MNGRQSWIGLGLAGGLIAAWLGCHVVGVFFWRWRGAWLAAAPIWVALQCWLNVGLFIVAHDAMHGSLAPGRARVNRAVGRLCLALYAGFSFDRLRPKHFQHHAHPGTARDPDFDADHPRAWGKWFLAFLRMYFGWRELAVLAALSVFYVVVLHARVACVLVFWALPAILSAVQLFTFGTYLPHRHDDEAFGDHHNARSSAFGYWTSLLTCFHFGYHLEHHSFPSVPWWALPGRRLELRARPQASA